MTDAPPHADLSQVVADQLLAARTAQGLSQSELAARLGRTQPAVARLEAPTGDLKLSTLSQWAAALGLEAHVHLEPAAPHVDDVGVVATGDGAIVYRCAPDFPFGPLGDLAAPGSAELEALLDDIDRSASRRRPRALHVVVHHDPTDLSAHLALVGIQTFDDRDTVTVLDVFDEHGFAEPTALQWQRATRWLDAGPLPHEDHASVDGRHWSALHVTRLPAVGSPAWNVALAASAAPAASVVSARATLTPNRRGALAEDLTLCALVATRDVAPLVDASPVALAVATGGQYRTALSTLPGGTAAHAPTHTTSLAFLSLFSPTIVGDDRGVFVGLTEPDATPLYLDPSAARSANLPPLSLVVGAPGSAAVPLTARLCRAAARAGGAAALISTGPGRSAGEDDADTQLTVGAATPGALDPFRWLPRDEAIRPAASFLAEAIGGGTEHLELLLAAAQSASGVSSPRFADLLDPLAHTLDGASARRLVELRESVPALAAVWGPHQSPLAAFPPGQVTVIGFGAPAEGTEIPPAALAGLAVLAAEHAMHELRGISGSLLVIDEAFPTAATLLADRAVRCARSLGIGVLLCSTRAGDIYELGMAQPASRVVAAATPDPLEAAAALRLAGLSPTPDRVSWLQQAGPTRALLRDAAGTTAAFRLHDNLPGARAVTEPDTPAALSQAAPDMVLGERYDMTLVDGTVLDSRLLVAQRAALDVAGEPTGEVTLTLRAPYGVSEELPAGQVAHAAPAA